MLLVREPNNEYDYLGIALHFRVNHRLGKLGYMPRELNQIPAHLMDQGVCLKATIADVDPTAEPWEMVLVKLVQLV